MRLNQQEPTTSKGFTFGAGFGGSDKTQIGSTPFEQSMATKQPQTTGLFGQPAATASNYGTATVKYQSQSNIDNLLKGGQTISVTTRQHCITFMKEYQGKSIEELRLEDYMANKKVSQAGTSSTQQASGMFKSPHQPIGGVFGQTSQSTQNTYGLFGSSSSMRGSAFEQANTGKPSFSFDGEKSSFGQSAQCEQKTVRNLFGQPLVPSAALLNTGFGLNTQNDQFDDAAKKSTDILRRAPIFGTKTGLSLGGTTVFRG
jgi:nuclear pore complex protein Nup98-Nup96